MESGKKSGRDFVERQCPISKAVLLSARLINDGTDGEGRDVWIDVSKVGVEYIQIGVCIEVTFKIGRSQPHSVISRPVTRSRDD